MNQEPINKDTTFKEESKKQVADTKNEVLAKLQARRHAVPKIDKKEEPL